MQLSIVAHKLAICRLAPGDPLPAWLSTADRPLSSLLTLTWTADELSVVCPQEWVPKGVTCAPDWAALKVVGPLDFALTGILAALLNPLASAGIPVFALSTYDTDYLLVREPQLAAAQTVLLAHGHQFL
ncbi:ACT domain-containing protein [Thermogemmatispora sp.]|uniref:ACT domain-containing protein n=1 Tax=Thermogemmatispora sp. TaxID=1968838 RepID=UPI001D2E033D|nr:ACT domain-containing protein [Thermogemmatispora sp.]MBX5450905.1 ACT domain-containing protein [Thermogemmatispora sp.]